MLDAFYGAFSPACFGLLGLWLVIVQMRLTEWSMTPRNEKPSITGAPTEWRCTSPCPAA